MSVKSDEKVFTSNFDLLFSGQFGRGPKKYIGSLPVVKCRFCEKSAPDVLFKKSAHAISELCGNHQLILRDECDTCNALFAESLEDHFGKYTKPFRILGQVRGKKKIPSYKLHRSGQE